jgi:hypothetical protein
VAVSVPELVPQGPLVVTSRPLVEACTQLPTVRAESEMLPLKVHAPVMVGLPLNVPLMTPGPIRLDDDDEGNGAAHACKAAEMFCVVPVIVMVQPNAVFPSCETILNLHCEAGGEEWPSVIRLLSGITAENAPKESQAEIEKLV